MTLEHLWAGWRSTYVTGTEEPDESVAATGKRTGENARAVEGGHGPSSCVFCRIAASGPPSPENGILWVGDHTFAVLNAYPYASGHLMVLPLRHISRLDEVDPDEGPELWSGLRLGVAALEAAYGPEGINLGANLGQAAGAGLPRHLHLHAVPRWLGDTNFMTAVAGARVLPEALPDTWKRLHDAWPR